MAPALALTGLAMAVSPAAAHVHAAASSWVKPDRFGAMDCNGWSPTYKSVVPSHRMLCTDPHGPLRTEKYSADSTHPGKTVRHWARFLDNHHYVGHDEPSVKFISSAANSGNTMTYYMQMPRDPKKRPTNSGSVVDYAELSPAPWFGLPMCDPGSYPQNPCTPDSDSNSGAISDPNAAGSAFMELQFYPPGFPPFADSVSCNTKRWCAALTIDSLESKFDFADLNPQCEEPQNFAFLATNGKPAGPPGPQKSNIHSFTPNKHTLLINPGDVLKISITDPASGFTTTVTDVTTGKTGWMTASAANGFMTTNYLTCAGKPFTFHAEYNTAAPQNQVPWAALQGGVLMEQETGHSEVCASLANTDPYTIPGFADRRIADTCVGNSEGGRKDLGEGPCDKKTGICKNATTQGTTGPISCPTGDSNSGQLCEFADGFCLPQGTRTVTLLHHKVTETSPINWCQANRFQNGDLDFDGVPYQRTSWPNGSPNVPTSIRYIGPFDQAGQTYPQIQFETDIPGSEFLCNTFTGLNCTAPPLSAKFYPFWTLTNKKGQNVGHGLFPAGACVWNFGNVIKGVTTRNLGKDAQYGAPAVKVYGGTTISRIMANPEVDTAQGCTALHMPA